MLRALPWLMLVGVLLAAMPATQDTATRTETTGPRFVAWDVFVDSSTASLGAYQFEWKVLSGDATIVGVEGGAPPAFAAAPYYDEVALQRQRILIGAFSTAAELPTGETRVARIHLMVEGPEEPEYQILLQAVADGEGADITASTTKKRWKRER